MYDKPPLLWAKRSNNTWFKLLEVDLAAIADYGVFVIWHGGYPSRTVCVGHGAIAAELARRCTERSVTSFLEYGPLYVTWAAADADDAAGIHRHLVDRLRPLIVDAAAFHALPLAANSPF
jgi:hypothetical protein